MSMPRKPTASTPWSQGEAVWQFEGQVAMVTGGGSGIGRSTAIAFGAAGAQVAVVDLSNDDARATADLIEGVGGRAIVVVGDLGQPAVARDAVIRTVSEFGGLNIGVNCAGISGSSDEVADIDEGVWHQVLAINLTGVWLCMKHQIRQMLVQGSGGRVVNLASTAGLRGFARSGAYVASKHGLVGLTKTAAREYASQGIRINAICPGFIKTPMTARHFEHNREAEHQLIAAHPIGRGGEPEEVANVALWLCSQAAGFVNGAIIPVDGAQIT